MSGNYVFYASKMEQAKAAREMDRPLRRHLLELLELVCRCEAEWDLDRPDRSRT